jgi:hypothetical protein
MGGTRIVYKLLVRRPVEKQPLGNLGIDERRMDLREIG